MDIWLNRQWLLAEQRRDEKELAIKLYLKNDNAYLDVGCERGRRLASNKLAEKTRQWMNGNFNAISVLLNLLLYTWKLEEKAVWPVYGLVLNMSIRLDSDFII